MNYQGTIARKLFWQDLYRNMLHAVTTGMLRTIRPVLFALRRHGIAVALLAPDGAGKSTLARELIQIDFLRARLIYMGSNTDASNIGLPATPWLKARVKSLKGSRWSPKAAIIRGLNFCNRLAEQWYRYLVGWYHKVRGRFVVFDRYTYDSYLAPAAKTIGKRIRRWLLKHACPPPDLVVLLDAPGGILYQRKGEHSPERLEEQRRVFLGLKDRISNLVVVDATRSADDVRRDVVSMIWKFYGNK